MISINNIGLSDVKQYAALCEEAFAPQTNMSQLEKILTALIANPHYILVGARDEDEQLLGSIMGIICMDPVGECCPFMLLENMVVSGRSRRQGVGEKLIRYMEERAREENCNFIMFTSMAKRKEAHMFYQAMGYPKDITQGFKKYL